MLVSRLLVLLVLLLKLTALPAQVGFPVLESDILTLQNAMENGQVTAVQLVDAYLARIAAYDQQGPELNSVIRLHPGARERAAELDRERRQNGPRSMLHGIPIIVKDNYNTVDLPTSGGSVSLAGFVPSANATQVDKLEAAGAIILAKSNLHEFAYGYTTISSLGGQTRNPYDPRRVPGGSSGGTAAAIAASLAAVGMGSDTCGSIRIPSAFNNLTGLRPSKGLSSIYGIMPLSHTQDVAGPLARTTTDLAIVLDVVSGFDPLDAATAIMEDRDPPAFYQQLDSVSLEGLRFGKLNNYFERAAGEVASVTQSALERFQDNGVEIIDLDIPDLAELLAASGLIGHEFRIDLEQYLALFLSEAMADLDDIVDQGGFHQAVVNALQRSQASVFNEVNYEAAVAARSELRERIEQVMDEYALDAIVYPPIVELPVFTGESQGGNNCSFSANSGLPALVVPAGFTSAGLPVGLELLGGFLSDVRLLSIGHQYESLANLRRAPDMTPALINGMAPEPLTGSFEFQQGALSVSATLQYDITTSQLSFTVQNRSENPADLHALVLVIDSDAYFELNDPVVYNLIKPAVIQSSGEVYADAPVRLAITREQLKLRVYGTGLEVNGITVPVNLVP